MFSNNRIVCAIELGTSKICALIGQVDPECRPTVIGRGIVPASGAIVKGEIFNMEKVVDLLAGALEEADRSSGGELENCRLVTVLVTGCGITSRQGNGIVTIKNPDRLVTEAELDEAHENARIIDLGTDQEIVNTSFSHFLLDKRRVSDPCGQSGSRLEACIHIICGQSGRLENFRTAVREAGLEEVPVELVFSPLAANIGVVGDKEKENGSLLLDIGAGVTEYIVNTDNGIRDSGMIQLGMEHVANDLSIGLGIPIDRCRKIIETGTLARASAAKQEFLEYPSVRNRTRKISVADCERIAEARLRELFEIIRERIAGKGNFQMLGTGGILTGGGAEFFLAKELFSDVFDLPCRIAAPTDCGGAVTELNDPRFAALWGALKSAAFFQQGMPEKHSVLQKLLERFSRSRTAKEQA